MSEETTKHGANRAFAICTPNVNAYPWLNAGDYPVDALQSQPDISPVSLQLLLRWDGGLDTSQSPLNLLDGRHYHSPSIKLAPLAKLE
jgi:hypothetical protein